MILPQIVKALFRSTLFERQRRSMKSFLYRNDLSKLALNMPEATSGVATITPNIINVTLKPCAGKSLTF